MREYFLFGIIIVGVLAAVGYALWLVGRALYEMYHEWQLHRDLDELERTADERKQLQGEAQRRRLDNGCEHVFDDAFGSFPPGVCRKCGLHEQRPTGSCDHVWRRVEGPRPGSQCEKCGKKHAAGGTVRH